MKKTRKSEIKKIISKIKNNDNFLITAHMNLEGDALGSELALYFLLKKLGKKVVIYNHDNTPQIYDFLPGYKLIKNKISRKKFDIIFFLDCSDLSRAGKVKDEVGPDAFVINIDHHISNTYFGDINWVEPGFSSTCEMIYFLIKRLNLIDNNIALCLYAGIFTDTGRFTYANTSPQTHKVVADLMNFNINPDKIDEKIHSICSPEDLRFIARQMLKLKLSPDKKICWALVSSWQEKNYDLTEVLFSIMRLLEAPLVFILFKKTGKKKTRINFRSRSNVDVNKIAAFFGGGGHKRASGTNLDQNLKESEAKVISLAQKIINEKRKFI